MPLAQLHITQRARRDIERLEDFLREGGDPTALDLLDFLLDGLDVLAHQPGIGRPVGQGLRELILTRGKSGYLARYEWRRDAGRVLVLRIRHQRETGYTDDEV